MAEPAAGFAGLLRELRRRARLTQQELADAARVSLRTVSDLERGVATTPQKETVRLLADALHLIGPPRVEFERVARGRSLPSDSEAAVAAVAAMRSLPRDTAAFTGRQRELEQLAKAALAAGGVVSIHAIGGMAGVGKTAFAVHAAHRLAGQFPGGQLFLSLHGHTPGQRPVDPADALASLLLAVGVPPAQVPPEPAARMALWRDRAASRPLLLVLDDAASSGQVEPLLPGAGSSLVLVTSRRHLSALDDATAISLDTLPPGEAAVLLVRLSGRAALDSGDPAVAEVARLCGHLPLAVGMMARQLRQHQAWTVAGRAAELASARDRLALMETENLSVAAAFDLSYAYLSQSQQRLFRRLGLHPGPDIDGYAAAALDGTSLAEARRGLEHLYDQYLLAEPSHGRYRPHDLIREHSRALAGRLDPDDDQNAAVTRLLDYYQHTGAVAYMRLRGRALPGPAADAGSAVVPPLGDLDEALAWSRAERAGLLACLDHAVAAGQQATAAGLTAGAGAVLMCDGPWTDAISLHTAAIEAARAAGDQLGEANALTDRSSVLRHTCDYPAAIAGLEQALARYRDLGERLGQAHALGDLGGLLLLTDDYPAAAQTLVQALDLYRGLGDQTGQARTLYNLGGVQQLTGDYQAALRTHQQALVICEAIGWRFGQANVLNYLGHELLLTGDYPAAVRAHRQALGVYRDLGDRNGEANALLRLGSALTLTGDYPEAAQALDGALRTFREFGSRMSEGNALCYLGVLRRHTGDYQAAAQALGDALSIFRDIGDRGGEVTALNERAAAHRLSGELARAAEGHHQSLELSRAIGSDPDEAHALAGLGRCALAEGRAAQGETLLREALQIMQRIGVPEAAEVAAELDALPGAQGPSPRGT
jgi:tetratricopeptide (TPR) repeat protein/transcriptional regulator with XRE-family HTH domain